VVALDGDHAAVRRPLLAEFQNAPYFFEQFKVAKRIVALGDRRVLPPLEPWLTAEDRQGRGNAAISALHDNGGSLSLDWQRPIACLRAHRLDPFSPAYDRCVTKFRACALVRDRERVAHHAHLLAGE
jgi:hypothetical protein